MIAFEGILTSLLEAYGEEHYRVGAALHNVGIANLRAGKLDDAMASIEEAVRMRKSTLGETHPKVAVSEVSVEDCNVVVVVVPLIARVPHSSLLVCTGTFRIPLSNSESFTFR